MKHRQLLSKVCEFIDGELDDETCEALQKHLAACPNCRIFVDSMRQTIVLYQHCDSPKKVPQAVRKRLYAKIALKLKPKKEK
jgi:anti-sigma factor (TIGR02949 family)